MNYYCCLALVGYQKVRLDAFLADLNQQKDMLDQLRIEVGRLQTDSLERRLCKSDIFPTVGIDFSADLLIVNVLMIWN